jgi:hypothetical protein
MGENSENKNFEVKDDGTIVRNDSYQSKGSSLKYLALALAIIGFIFQCFVEHLDGLPFAGWIVSFFGFLLGFFLLRTKELNGVVYRVYDKETRRVGVLAIILSIPALWFFPIYCFVNLI